MENNNERNEVVMQEIYQRNGNGNVKKGFFNKHKPLIIIGVCILLLIGVSVVISVQVHNNNKKLMKEYLEETDSAVMNIRNHGLGIFISLQANNMSYTSNLGAQILSFKKEVQQLADKDILQYKELNKYNKHLKNFTSHAKTFAKCTNDGTLNVDVATLKEGVDAGSEMFDDVEFLNTESAQVKKKIGLEIIDKDDMDNTNNTDKTN